MGSGPWIGAQASWRLLGLWGRRNLPCRVSDQVGVLPAPGVILRVRRQGHHCVSSLPATVLSGRDGNFLGCGGFRDVNLGS